MNREIITDPLDAKDLKVDLRQNMVLLQEWGIYKILLLFGYAWGNSYYRGIWKDIPVTPGQVENLVTEIEHKGYGALGNDNLYITIPDLEVRLQYSYECDIHLSYSIPDDFVQSIYDRWTAKDWFIESKRRRL